MNAAPKVMLDEDWFPTCLVCSLPLRALPRSILQQESDDATGPFTPQRRKSPRPFASTIKIDDAMKAGATKAEQREKEGQTTTANISVSRLDATVSAFNVRETGLDVRF